MVYGLDPLPKGGNLFRGGQEDSDEFHNVNNPEMTAAPMLFIK